MPSRRGLRSPNALNRRASTAFYLIFCVMHFRRQLLRHTPATRLTKHWLLVRLDLTTTLDLYFLLEPAFAPTLTTGTTSAR